MKIIASESGDFTRAKGKEVMEEFFTDAMAIKLTPCMHITMIWPSGRSRRLRHMG